MPCFTAAQIAQHVGGELIGPSDVSITGIAGLDRAQPNQISFIRDAANAHRWTESAALVVLAPRNLEVPLSPQRAMIRVDDPDLALISLLTLFAPSPVRPTTGIHSSAVVHPEALIGADVAIGSHCTVSAGVRLGDRCVLHAHVTLMEQCEIGSDCELYPGVVVRERCTLGSAAVLHANVVIGADGFGYRPAPDGSGLLKIPHIGGVTIGDNVEIGAGTCVDRGKFNDTTIGDGTKIDNLCQIAHNCRIGRHCVIAGQTGLAGSVTIGDGAVIGGKVAVKDQVTIGAGASIAGSAAVMDDVPAGQTWGGYPAREVRFALREYAAIRKLPELVKLLRKK